MVFDEGLRGNIRIPKTAEVLASRIRRQIITGALKAGDQLPPEAKMIAEFEVSRPTIREAIRLLESEGLITVTRGPRGGARVNNESLTQVTMAAGLALQTRGATIADIYEARALLEPSAARLAAERRGEAAAKVLRAHIAHEWTTLDDDVARARAVADFHRILLEECGNVALSVVGRALKSIVERHMELAYGRERRRSPAPPSIETGGPRVGFRSHEKLVAFIAEGDGAAAEAHWVRHMSAASEFWLHGVAGEAIIDVLD